MSLRRRISESCHDELSNSCYSSNGVLSPPQVMRPSRSSENLQSASAIPSAIPSASSPSTMRRLSIPIETIGRANDAPVDDDSGVVEQRNSTTSRHNRGMSDPFDAQRMMDVLSSSAEEPLATAATTGDNQSSSPQHHLQPYPQHHYGIVPTLPRYPVAATKNCNCWSETNINKFSVRSASYLDDKKKTPSAAYLLSPRGADLLLFDEVSTTTSSSSSSYAEPTTPLPFEKFLNGKLLKQPTIAIIFRFPWGCMNQYFALPEMYLPFLRQRRLHNASSPLPLLSAPLLPSMADFSPSQKSLAEWLAASDDQKNARLKLIALVDEGPFLVRQLVTGRPVLIGTKLALTYHYVQYHDVLLCELNIGSGSTTAKRIVSVCRRYMNALTVDLGWLIQAETAEHLPETMLGAIRLHHPDALKAPKLAVQSPTFLSLASTTPTNDNFAMS